MIVYHSTMSCRSPPHIAGRHGGCLGGAVWQRVLQMGVILVMKMLCGRSLWPGSVKLNGCARGLSCQGLAHHVGDLTQDQPQQKLTPPPSWSRSRGAWRERFPRKASLQGSVLSHPKYDRHSGLAPGAAKVVLCSQERVCCCRGWWCATKGVTPREQTPQTILKTHWCVCAMTATCWRAQRARPAVLPRTHQPPMRARAPPELATESPLFFHNEIM